LSDNGGKARVSALTHFQQLGDNDHRAICTDAHEVTKFNGRASF
jgi:hypothetical protein